MKNISAKSVFVNCVGLVLATVFVSPVLAFNFDAGGVKGALDTDLTYGLQYRTEDADPANTSAYGNRALYSDRGDIFSNQVRASVTLALEFSANYGALVRGNYFFDFEANDADLGAKLKMNWKAREILRMLMSTVTSEITSN